MSQPEEQFNGLFHPHPKYALDDPSNIVEIVTLINLACEDPQTKLEACLYGLHDVSFGAEIDGQEQPGHPLLAIAMFRGIVDALNHFSDDEAAFIFNYELISTIQACTEGPRTGRNYQAALALVREQYPLTDRQAFEGMNDYEEYILIECLDEARHAVLPEAVETFTDILLAEVAAIRAGKSIIEVSPGLEERIVGADAPEATWDDLADSGAEGVLTVDHNDGTLTQTYYTEESSPDCLLIELACQASTVLPDLDILGIVTSHPEFDALSEKEKIQILSEFVADAEESGHPEMISRMFESVDQHQPSLGVLIRLEFSGTSKL